jgi:hypothetical protein
MINGDLVQLGVPRASIHPRPGRHSGWLPCRVTEMSDPGTTVRVMIRCDAAKLTEYVASHGDRARLALRGVPDVNAALAALQRAAATICDIPHPDEPSAPLPNWSDAFLVDGEPVLHLDVQDWGQAYAQQIIDVVVRSLMTADLDGRLEPALPPPEQFLGL